MSLTNCNHILVVDDEDSVRFFLSEELQGEGYRVDTAANGTEALSILEQYAIDLAIVDYQMPGISGLELMTMMQSLPDVPELIMITAHATLDTSIKAMRLGSCDFLLKPYEFENLLRGVKKAMVRRQQKTQQKLAAELLTASLGLSQASLLVQGQGVIQVDDLTLYIEEMSLHKKDDPIPITPTEFRLLAAMMKNPYQPFTFQQLAHLTHNRHFQPHQARDLLKSHLGRLRRKLGERYIINVRGVGYKFTVA